MSASGLQRRLLVLAGVMVIVVVGVVFLGPALGQRGSAPESGPRYSVIDTQGHTLIVTDNQRDTLNFYTTDEEEPIGSGLKLRGRIDLKQVGQPVIRPLASAAGSAPATIIVIVPADAELFFDGEATRQRGSEREFVTPPLEVGKGYHYNVVARWTSNGKPVEKKRRVPVKADARVRVDFLAAE
jgi:uncharacterized protein (TIGR03000 family)